MTAQAPEIIYYRGNKYRLIVEPLEMYLRKKIIKPRIKRYSTANRRGYIGTWKIENEKLYLEKLYSHNREEMKLKSKLFPEIDGLVFAEWYSGSLVCPHGEAIRYIHAGYESAYERYLILNVEQGKLKNEQDLSLEEYNDWRLMMRKSKPWWKR
jgi:hypothetical protein